MKLYLSLALLITFSPLALAAEEFVSVCDRSEAVRDFLEGWFQKSCLRINSIDLKVITVLRLTGYNFVELWPKDLSGLIISDLIIKDVDKLILHANTFENRAVNNVDITRVTNILIEPGAFAKFNCTNEMSLHGTNLTIESGAFEKANINSLILMAGEISLAPNLFTTNAFTQGLQIFADQLEGAHDGMFSSLENLQFLALITDTPLSLKADFFSGLTRLRRLTIHANEIESDAFKFTPNLTFIDLNGSKDLHFIPDGTFAELKHLESLDVTDAPLTRTRKAAFKGVPDVDGLPPEFEGDLSEWGTP